MPPLRPRRPEAPEVFFARLFGRHLKTLREKKDWRLADVAVRARRQGLPWVPSTVKQIELGKRQVLLAESVLLDKVYECDLSEIADRTAIAAWLERRTRTTLARNFALAQWGAVEDRLWLREVGHTPDYPRGGDVPVIEIDRDDQIVILDSGDRRAPLPEWIEYVAGREAELDATKNLSRRGGRWHPHQVALRAWKLQQAGVWTEASLTDERDLRMEAAEQQDPLLQVPATTDRMKKQQAERRRALRGHISRRLLEDIKAMNPSRSASAFKPQPAEGGPTS